MGKITSDGFVKLSEISGDEIEQGVRLAFLDRNGKLQTAVCTTGGVIGSTAVLDPNPFASGSGGYGRGAFGRGPFGAAPMRALDLVTGPPEVTEATLAPRHQDFKASGSMQFGGSAKLTVVRNRPPSQELRRQARVAKIRLYAPYAVELATDLIVATEQKQLNDLDAEAALDALRDLRDALNEIIEAAAKGKAVEKELSRVRKLTKIFGEALRRAGKRAFDFATLCGMAYLMQHLGIPVEKTLGDAITGLIKDTDEGQS